MLRKYGKKILHWLIKWALFVSDNTSSWGWRFYKLRVHPCLFLSFILYIYSAIVNPIKWFLKNSILFGWWLHCAWPTYSKGQINVVKQNLSVIIMTLLLSSLFKNPLYICFKTIKHFNQRYEYTLRFLYPIHILSLVEIYLSLI